MVVTACLLHSITFIVKHHRTLMTTDCLSRSNTRNSLFFSRLPNTPIPHTFSWFLFLEAYVLFDTSRNKLLLEINVSITLKLLYGSIALYEDENMKDLFEEEYKTL